MSRLITTCEFLDITPYLEQGANPEKCLRRTGHDVWQVRKEPVQFDQDERTNEHLNWALQRSGDLVRIPLIPYRSNSMQPHELIMGMIDMATRCVIDHHKAIRVHWIVGNPVEDLRSESVEAFRVWVGLAMQMH